MDVPRCLEPNQDHYRFICYSPLASASARSCPEWELSFEGADSRKNRGPFFDSRWETLQRFQSRQFAQIDSTLRLDAPQGVWALGTNLRSSPSQIMRLD